MSYCKLKTNLETLPPHVVRNFILSDDLKHLVIYNESFFIVINLQSKNIILSNEGHEQLRIKYCAIDNDVLVVQYQTVSGYLVHIRGLKSALYCHEVETDQEFTCHVKADFSLDNNNEILGLFFGTTTGRVKFFSFRGPIQLVDLNLKFDPKINRQKLRQILIFPDPDIRLFVTVDEAAVLMFYTFDTDFNCTWKNTYLATTEKNGLVNVHRIVTSQTETFLGIVLNTDDRLSLQTTDPKNFTETRENVDSVFVRTNLCQSDPYTKCVLLKENRYNPIFTSQGDVIALIDEGKRKFVNIKFFFLKTGEELEYQYRPEEKLMDSIGTLFIDKSGLLLQPQLNNQSKRKINICLVLNKGTNVLFDQIRVPEDDQQLSRIDKEKYTIFRENFELTPQGFGFIEAWNLLARPVEKTETGEPNMFDMKQSFVEFLLNNEKYQILVDILLHKIRKEGEEEETFTMLELERCEEAIYRIFEQRKGETWFDYNNIDQNKLYKYKTFLSNVLKTYNAIIKRKREEALGNLIALNIKNINRMEDEILSTFSSHKNKVQREHDFCQALEFVADYNIAQVYTQNFEAIQQNWANKRRDYDLLFQDSVEILKNQEQFFIDLFTNETLIYPAPIEDIFRWIRNSETYLEKKFLIYYIIKKDFLSLLSEVGDITAEYIRVLNEGFLKKFNLTDLEINYINGLVSLDLLIEKAKFGKDRDGNPLSRYQRNEEILGIAKEACYNLSLCNIDNDEWKDFILNVFYQYECHDELVIFMRSGHINWSDPMFARKHVAIMIKAKKVVQAYYFVLMQVELNEADQQLNPNYEDLFYFFIDQVISEGLTRQLYNICLKNHEKILFRNYFEINPEYSKFYILYLLKLDQVIEAADFYTQYAAQIEKDESIVRFLVWKIGELPELIRSKVEENYPQLYTRYKELKNSLNTEQSQKMLEEFSTSQQRKSLRGGLRQQEEYSSEKLLESTTERLYDSSGKKGKVNFSAQGIRELLENKDKTEERLGLVFNKPEKRVNGFEEFKNSDKMELEKSSKKRQSGFRADEMEEELPKNVYSSQRMSLERNGVFGVSVQQAGVADSIRNNTPFGGRQSTERMSESSMGSMRKKLSLLF